MRLRGSPGASPRAAESPLLQLESGLDFLTALLLDKEGEERDHATERGDDPLCWFPAGFGAQVYGGNEECHVAEAVNLGGVEEPPRRVGGVVEDEVLVNHLGTQQEQHHTREVGSDGEVRQCLPYALLPIWIDVGH